MVCSVKMYPNRMVDVGATNAELVTPTFSLVQDVTGAPDPVISSIGPRRGVPVTVQRRLTSQKRSGVPTHLRDARAEERCAKGAAAQGLSVLQNSGSHTA
jgi:hypothetical protein